MIKPIHEIEWPDDYRLPSMRTVHSLKRILNRQGLIEPLIVDRLDEYSKLINEEDADRMLVGVLLNWYDVIIAVEEDKE